MASAPIGASYPGVLPTTTNSDVALSPQMPYKGDTFTPGTFHCRLEAAPGAGKTLTLKLWEGGVGVTEVAAVTIAGTDVIGTDASVSGTLADGEFYQASCYNHDGVAADLSWVVGP